ncbi:MAG: hypothetical protein IKU26_04510 [Clostridia bacterium]|nr:hypothetical protein [Clostridia bacterium]
MDELYVLRELSIRTFRETYAHLNTGEFQNKGFGRYWMDQAVYIAAENEKTIHFYEKNGFYTIGTHIFIIGEDAQTDYIMRKGVT